MKIVVMTRTYRSLQPGEAAGFDDAVADQLVAQGSAVSEADWDAEAEEPTPTKRPSRRKAEATEAEAEAESRAEAAAATEG